MGPVVVTEWEDAVKVLDVLLDDELLDVVRVVSDKTFDALVAAASARVLTGGGLSPASTGLLMTAAVALAEDRMVDGRMFAPEAKEKPAP